MNQKSQQAWSTVQQEKLRQLQLEVAALEKQLENLVTRVPLTNDYNLQSPIPLIYVSDRTAKTGIRLAHDTIS